MEKKQEECPAPGEETWLSSEITCITCGTQGSFPSLIYSLSDESLCLVTDHELEPEDMITITSLEEKPEGKGGAGRMSGMTGIVQWIREVEREHRNLYLAGVNLPLETGAEEPDEANACRMCGRSTGAEESELEGGLVWLCPECQEHLEERPEKMNELIRRFLLGNPL
jgi:hypothetical protein